jgi:hypothetical protein
MTSKWYVQWQCQGHTITQCYIYISMTVNNTILHIQGNIRHCRGNYRIEVLVIILRK